MGARFEILHKGERVCISGIDGVGVLSAIVNYVAGTEGDCNYGLSISGLGCYTENSNERQHVGWQGPEIKEGDEVTIRILSAGDFDDPAEMTRSPEKTIEDPDFGLMNYRGKAWHADIPWEFPPIAAAHLHLPAGESGPTGLQRQLILELRQQYETLWPKIADAIVKCHEVITTSAELEERLNSCIGIDIREKSDRIGLSYHIPCKFGADSFFVTLHNWEIIEFCSAS